jgi:hypothetical protein
LTMITFVDRAMPRLIGPSLDYHGVSDNKLKRQPQIRNSRLYSFHRKSLLF